jgi:hypothetical protein
LPQAVDHLLHLAAGAGIERTEGLVHQQDPGSVISACAMATRCCMPPDSCSGYFQASASRSPCYANTRTRRRAVRGGGDRIGGPAGQQTELAHLGPNVMLSRTVLSETASSAAGRIPGCDRMAMLAAVDQHASVRRPLGPRSRRSSVDFRTRSVRARRRTPPA